MSTSDPITIPSTQEICEARERITEDVTCSPLIPLDGYGRDQGGIWLKLECLQAIGSFKIRGAANAIRLADPAQLEHGVYTASAGNMAQGVALAAKRLGLPCRVIVPDTAPEAKTDAIKRLQGEVVSVPFDEWWQVLVEHRHPSETGFFIHPVSNPAVIAGNGTVGLEIMEQLPDVDAIVVPFGGGGLSCGIAAAIRERTPSIPVYAAEVETAAPLSASFALGAATAIRRTPTFVDGIGGTSVLKDMWPLARVLIESSLTISVSEVCDAIRTLVSKANVIAEGAGASSVAAALRHLPSDQRTVAVVSGGNIDRSVLKQILSGETPR